MKLRVAISIALTLALTGCVKDTAVEVKVTTEDEKTLYALGMILGRNVSVFQLTPEQLAIVQRGMSDQVLGRDALVKIEEYGPKVDEMAKKSNQSQLTARKAKEQAFLEQAAKEPNAVKTDSGLVYQELKAGEGNSPTPEDTVKVHYTGKLTDGTEFDSSRSGDNPEPRQFGLGRVIKCWTEGIQRMKPGGQAKLVCPSEIAYGDRGRPPTIPGGSTLVFDVELLEVLPRPEAPATLPGMPPGGMPPGALPPGMLPPGHPWT